MCFYFGKNALSTLAFSEVFKVIAWQQEELCIFRAWLLLGGYALFIIWRSVMNMWSVLLIVAVASVFLAILIHKIAKWTGKYETVSMYLLLFGLLFTPTCLVMGAFAEKQQIQLIAIGVFLLLIVLCFSRLYRSDHAKKDALPAVSNYCPYCGKDLQTDMKFCPSCGREISAHGGKRYV